MSQAAVPTFSIGEAIGWAWKLTWRNFWRFLLVAVVFFFLNAAISAVVSIPTNVTQGLVDTSGASDAQSIALGAGALLFGLISGVVQFVVTSFLTFATIRIALSVTRGEDVELKTAFVFKGFGWYLLCALVVGILAAVGFLVPTLIFGGIGFLIGDNTGIVMVSIGVLIGVLVAIVISVGFTFFGYAIVDRDATGLDGLKVSWELVRPHFWKVVGLGVLLALIAVGLLAAALVAGVLMIVIGLLVTLPLAGVLIFGLGSLSYAFAYQRMSGNPIAN